MYKSSYSQNCLQMLPTLNPHNISRKIHERRNTVFNRMFFENGQKRTFLESLVKGYIMPKRKPKTVAISYLSSWSVSVELFMHGRYTGKLKKKILTPCIEHQKDSIN